jgi:geranylgeranyl pyrophosphate synthase
VGPDLDHYLAEVCAQVEAELDRRLPQPTDDPLRLWEACRYAMLGGGKRLRPALVFAACEAVGGARDGGVLAAACALEAVHGYSLVHDDLPCMDDDDVRRGRPTVHCAFGEACALLCGDALLTIAFEWLAEAGRDTDHPAAFVRAVQILGECAGARGMVGGQALDLALVGRALSVPETEALARLKTAALFRAAALLGGLLGGGDEAALDALGRYGEALGVAFQHRDDLLDESHPEVEMGQRARLAELCATARNKVERFGARAAVLKALAEAIATA